MQEAISNEELLRTQEIDDILGGRPAKKTVEEWLNEVDYSLDPGYKPSEFALHFINFIKLVNGEIGEEHKSPVLHFRMLDQVPGRKQDILNMVFRGAAKTTVLGEYLFLYLAVYREIPGFGEIPLALYVSDSIENGVKNMRKNLEYRWENSDFLRKYIPSTRFTDIRWEFVNAEGKTLVVKGYGAKTGVRGTKEMGQRPYLAILDDLISDEDARSDTVIKSIEDTIYKAIDYALHPTRKKVIWSGTPFNSKDPLYKAVESGAYYVNVYPVCNEFPCKKEDFQSAWPDRFTYDYVMRQYEKAKSNGKIHTFDQELMLRIMSDDDRLVSDEQINWYSLTTLRHNKERFNYYITTDFATSDSDAADYSVISVWALNNRGDWFWVDGVVERQLMNKNIDDLFRLAQEWMPQSVGIEVSGQQAGFIPWIQNEMMNRNIFFSLASMNNKNSPGLRPAHNKGKMERFNVVLPWFALGKIYFPKELEFDPRIMEFMTELRLVSANGFRSKHDDCLDTISQLALLTTWKPSEEDDPEDTPEDWIHDEPYLTESSYIV